MALFVSYTYSTMGTTFGFGNCTFPNSPRLPAMQEILSVKERAAKTFNKANPGYNLEASDVVILNMLVLPDDDPAETP